MPSNARERRHNKNLRPSKPALVVVPKPKTEVTTLRTPTTSDPASWTPEFCHSMARLSRVDENPLPPHVWAMRGHVIAYTAEQGKKHPFSGMPVNEHGAEIVVPTPAIPGDWKTELIGALSERTEQIMHSDP